MRLRHESRYAAAPAQVRAMLLDPAFRRRVGEAQDIVSGEVSVAGERIELDQLQRTDHLPAIAAKIAGATTRAVIVEDWQGDVASFSITTPGKPTSATGTRTLRPDGPAGTVVVIELDVVVKVPLIGGKLEALMAENITTGLRDEERVAAAWLSGEH
ncbi:DUF2505 domain-containing protein [Nocardioides sp.]|uniref:DUF2505 domain-containing protein n=1 Tax=Nocardioides sp. TaxID=35761 RepID=UPI003517ECEC